MSDSIESHPTHIIPDHIRWAKEPIADKKKHKKNLIAIVTGYTVGSVSFYVESYIVSTLNLTEVYIVYLVFLVYIVKSMPLFLG